MDLENRALCPICYEQLNERSTYLTAKQRILCRCPNCGTYEVSELLDLAPMEHDIPRRSVLSHAVREMTRNGLPFITPSLAEGILKRSLPTASEQCNSFLLWLSEALPVSGRKTWVDGRSHRAVIGAESVEGFEMILDYLAETDLVKAPATRGTGTLTRYHAMLSVKGWEYVERLRREHPDSRLAFMAMEYGDTRLDRVFLQALKPAAAATGFDLRRLDEKPRAGLIDDRLRVEIRNARFLLADLTHENAGAYWEAGFAEGLGRPVIYTCEASKFANEKTHFDTNHHLTITWDEGNLAGAAESLKATIRATLPGEAKMVD